MKITIGKFEIESDSRQFIIYCNRKKGIIPAHVTPMKGDTKRELIGYYSTLESALLSLPTKVLLKSDAKSLSECLAELKEYRELIELAMLGV